ncbi:TPA: PglZ domain-containing protein [Candidatus Bathyarchaeota archaeon]|nr:PglZ domain-containing protein [Candidatus Bathyarchaeota archaeon]
MPKREKIETWARLAREWLQHTALKKGFIEWSNKLAKKYDIRSELDQIENLIDVMSFAVVDEVLIEELRTRISLEPGSFKKNLKIIDKIAKSRIKSPWATRAGVNVWQAISLASQLYSLCEKAISLLQERVTDVRSLTDRYIENRGWWMIDSLYRELSTFIGIEEDLQKTFLEPSFNIYARWLRLFTERFSNAVEGLEQWKIEGLLSQFEFWRKIVEKETKPLAILLIDALRYELGKELEKGLREEGYEVEIIPMLSSLPSITEVGMASLMPCSSLSAKVEKGKLQVLVNGSIQIGQRATREKFLKEKLGVKALILELSDIQQLSPISLKGKIKGYEYIIVMDRDIDIAGTYLLEISPRLFQELILRLTDSIKKLHKAGLRTVIVTTDHGFLLIPKGYSVDIVEEIKAQSNVDKKRRYAVGKPPYNPSLVCFKFDQIGFEGEGVVAFPRGLTCLSMPGPVPIFLHGGISPQENCISVIISKAKIESEKVMIEAKIPDDITTAVFLVELIPIPKPSAEKARTVKVEVYSEGKKIAESDTFELLKDKRKARLKLKEIRPEAEIRVVDADTREILKSKMVKIHIVGYFEEI